MKTIAVTGGIAAGKSTVTDYLISKGYMVVDADKMAREMTGPGGKAMPYILEHFGPDYIENDGSLKREAMRDLVFQNPKYKAVLEAGTTAVVIRDIEIIRAEAAERGLPVMFFDIPLLFEMKLEDRYDEVWVITADRNIRSERIRARDGLNPELIDLIIGSQADEEYKISRADRVFCNNGTIEELIQSVDKALQMIL